MPLPNSTTISISQIRSELAEGAGSLRTLSASANKGTPDSMSEFWGYSDFYTIDMYILAGGGGGGRGASFQGGGGGGAGGFVKARGYSVRKGTTIAVTVGGGGGGGNGGSPGHGGTGGESKVQGSFGEITAYGGGYGGGYTLTGGQGGSGGGGGRDACSNYQAPAIVGTLGVQDGVGGFAGGRAYFCGCGSASGGGGAYNNGKDAMFDCGNGWDSNLVKGGIAWVPGGNGGIVGCETDIGNNQWCGTGGAGASETNGGPVQAEWRSGDAYSRGGNYSYCSSNGLGGAGDGGGGSRATCGENGGSGGYGNVWVIYDGGQRGQGGYSIQSKDGRTNHVFRYSGTYTVNF